MGGKELFLGPEEIKLVFFSSLFFIHCLAFFTCQKVSSEPSGLVASSETGVVPLAEMAWGEDHWLPPAGRLPEACGEELP